MSCSETALWLWDFPWSQAGCVVYLMEDRTPSACKTHKCGWSQNQKYLKGQIHKTPQSQIMGLIAVVTRCKVLLWIGICAQLANLLRYEPHSASFVRICCWSRLPRKLNLRGWETAKIKAVCLFVCLFRFFLVLFGGLWWVVVLVVCLFWWFCLVLFLFR